MQLIMRIALMVTLALNLVGCYSIIKTPEIATALIYGPHVSGGSLSPQEAAQLSSWMKLHDAGWRGTTETHPAVITMAIVMREPSGRQSSLNLFESKDGTAVAYFNAPSPALPVHRYLSEADVSALWAAVGEPKRPRDK
jgi:hypothetical protein